MKKHICIAMVAALGLTACSNSAALQNSALRVVLGEEDAQAGPFPRFAPLRAAGRGPALDISITGTDIRGGFLRESSSDGIDSWLGTDGVGLTFDRGVLHGTRGLGSGMLASDVKDSADAILAGRSAQVERFHTFLDGDDQAVTRIFVCDVRNMGSDSIRVDRQQTQTRKMVETCRNLTDNFENTYWVDTRRGTIVQSLQWAGSFVGQLFIKTVYDF